MIPPKTFRAIVFTTTIAWYFGAVPFKFVTNRNGVKTIKASFTKARTVFVYSCFVVSNFYMFFIAFRAFQKVALESEQASQDFIVKMGYLILSYLMPVVLQINTLIRWEELPRVVSSYLTFFRKVKARYILPGERGPKCIKFFSAVLTIGMLVTLQNFLINIKKPDTLHFLTSLLPKPSKTPFIIRMPFLVTQAWIWINTWAT
ncbi:unnamed protein product [Orchesella dallaii]|uniref:Gustatory receptor n=1 Tax=Orchesella dallaii TaxID=48710 RepID=A0ABP1PS32_9HEXA